MQVSSESDQINGEEEDRQTIKSQTFHQSRQLRPPPPHSIHARARITKRIGQQRYFQGADSARGCEEGDQEGFRGEVCKG